MTLGIQPGYWEYVHLYDLLIVFCILITIDTKSQMLKMQTRCPFPFFSEQYSIWACTQRSLYQKLCGSKFATHDGIKLKFFSNMTWWNSSDTCAVAINTRFHYHSALYFSLVFPIILPITRLSVSDHVRCIVHVDRFNTSLWNSLSFYTEGILYQNEEAINQNWQAPKVYGITGKFWNVINCWYKI